MKSVPKSSKLRDLFAIVGLGVSDFGYRMFVFGGFNAWIRCTGMAMANEMQEIVSHEECIKYCFLALPLLFSQFISFIALQSFFAHPPRPVYTHIYIATFLLQIHIA